MATWAIGKVARVAAPIVFLLCASSCVFAYFGLVNTVVDSSGSAARPLSIGVFLSDRDSFALNALRSDGGGASPGWQVEVAGDGDGAALVNVNFGQVSLDQFGQTYASGDNYTLKGTLSHAVTLVYTLPPGALPKQTGDELGKIVALSPGMRNPLECARWTDLKGRSKVVKTTWDQSGDGWPDVAICHIPAFINARNVDIYLATHVDVPSLHESFSGKSSLSISNPQTLTTTMDQQEVPESLLYTASKPYDLHLNPPRGRSFGAIQPLPNGAGPIGARVWHVAAGGFVATDLTDGHKQNVAEVMEQLLLILVGFFFGLFASTLSAAARALRAIRSGRARSASGSQ